MGRHNDSASPPSAKALLVLSRTDFKDWMEALRGSNTATNGTSQALYVEKKIGESRTVDISTRDIELFQPLLLKQGLAQTAVNDISMIVRHIEVNIFLRRDSQIHPSGQHQSWGVLMLKCWAGLSLSDVI